MRVTLLDEGWKKRKNDIFARPTFSRDLQKYLQLMLIIHRYSASVGTLLLLYIPSEQNIPGKDKIKTLTYQDNDVNVWCFIPYNNQIFQCNVMLT